MTFKLSLLNLALRGLTLASRFILLLFMARSLSPTQVGVFGLLSTTISFALFFLGLDFYVFTTRELLAKEARDQACILRDQIALYAVAWLVMLPLLSLVFTFRLLPWAYLSWFYVLLIMEHLSQEAYRLFTALSRPLFANLLLFLRSGAWAYAVVVVLWLEPTHESLAPVLSGWIVGVLGSLLIAAWELRGLAWKKALAEPVNWAWIRMGATQSLLFLSATLSVKGMEYADRYFIQYYLGESMVGVYVFYTSMAGVIQTCIYAGVISLLYPRLIHAHQTGKFQEYRMMMRRLSLGTLTGTLFLTGFFALAISPIVSLIGKPTYASHLAVFRVLLLSAVLLSLSYIPHYGLYAQRYDRPVFGSAFAGLFVALVANSLLVPRYGLMGAAVANTMAIAVLCGIKTFFLFKPRRN